MVQPVSNNGGGAFQAFSAARGSGSSASEGSGRSGASDRGGNRDRSGRSSREDRQNRERQSTRRATRKLPETFRQRLSFGVIPQTDDMFIRVISTQSNRTVEVRPPVAVLKSNLAVHELVGRFLDRQA